LRIWTLHPKYLDPQGLVALWREALLAQKVLRGLTRGYRHHPQLRRFKEQASPVSAINAYLRVVVEEATARGYAFDRSKVGPVRKQVRMTSTKGQMRYEWRHLLRKLKTRNPVLYRKWRGEMAPQAHPLFRIRAGAVESWERR
jgi:hypothetical protein